VGSSTMVSCTSLRVFFGAIGTPPIGGSNFVEAPTSCDTPPHSLRDSNANSKMKTMKKKVGVHSLVYNTLGVKGCAKALGWGLRRMTSKSIIHMDLHKLNNKLVSVRLEHFWCTDKPHA